MNKEEFKINKEQFFDAIEQLAAQNLLEQGEILDIIKESVIKSFHSKLDPDADLELILDPKTKNISLINKTKYVVNGEVEDKYRPIEVPLNVAKKINSDAKEGDVISEEVDFATYSKQIAGQIRQLITQTVREKNKKAVYARHKGLKGEMVSAIVTSSATTHAILQLEDGTPAFMPSKLKNPKIKLNNGQRVSVYVEDVLEEAKEAQIIVSNGSKQIVKRVLEEEVPEISDGTIEIVSLSRIPGERTKVAVKTSNQDVDAVGAIIGAAGSRIKSIISKLDGEKLDVIEFSDDKNTFIASSLSPAKVISIIDKKDDEGNIIPGHKIAITPNKHQTLAIGKRGMNVRLAVELSDVRIDVLSIDNAREQNLEFAWNGNINEEQVRNIEAGIRPVREVRQRRGEGASTSQKINIDSLDSDIQSFNDEMDTFTISEESTAMNDFTIDEEKLNEETFTPEELNTMEKDFDFDEADIDADFLGE